MSTKISGRVVGVRVQRQFGSVTLVIKNGETTREIGLSKKQLYAKGGIIRPHALIGAQFSGEFHEVGTEIVNPAGGTITQTQERLDRGRGIKDFVLTLSAAQDLQQGQLESWDDQVKSYFAASTATMLSPNAASAPEAPAAPAVDAPAVAELAGEILEVVEP